MSVLGRATLKMVVVESSMLFITFYGALSLSKVLYLGAPGILIISIKC
jgi:hypothetical protein